MAPTPPPSRGLEFLRKLRKDTKDIPIIGKHIGRLGRTAEIMAMPCNVSVPTAIFAVTGTLPDAIGFALFTLFKPTKTDYLVSRFGRGGRHRPADGGGGNKRSLDLYKGLNRIFELQRILTKSGQDLFLLRTIELARLIGWYMTIVEATTAGLLRWVSQTYTVAGCEIPPDASVEGIIVPPAALIFSGAWLNVDIWTWTDVYGTTTSGGATRIVKDTKWTCTFQIDWHADPALPGTQIEFRLVQISGGGAPNPIKSRYDGSTSLAGGGTRSFHYVESPVNQDVTAQTVVQYFVSGGPGVYVDGGFININIHKSYEELVGLGLGHDP